MVVETVVETVAEMEEGMVVGMTIQIWGTLSTGLFATPELAEKVGVGGAGLFYGGGFHQLGIQALGLIGSMAYVFIVAFLILSILKVTIGLRVTEEEEVVGLDLSEHGGYGYPELLQKEKRSGTKADAKLILKRVKLQLPRNRDGKQHKQKNGYTFSHQDICPLSLSVIFLFYYIFLEVDH